MSNIAIKVENLGKKHLIKHQQKESYQAFQDMLLNGSRDVISSLNPFNKNMKKTDNSIEEFWALDDVSFEINKGDNFRTDFYLVRM